MAEAVRNGFVVLFCMVGVVFFVGATVGLLRCPDLYARLHPSTKGDTLGACSVVLALCVYSGLTIITLKLIAVVFFLLLSSAVCGHAIGRSAFKSGVEPWHKEDVVPWPDDRGEL